MEGINRFRPVGLVDPNMPVDEEEEIEVEETNSGSKGGENEGKVWVEERHRDRLCRRCQAGRAAGQEAGAQ